MYLTPYYESDLFCCLHLPVNIEESGWYFTPFSTSFQLYSSSPYNILSKQLCDLPYQNSSHQRERKESCCDGERGMNPVPLSMVDP